MISRKNLILLINEHLDFDLKENLILETFHTIKKVTK
jgi:hypothetical protein